MSYAIWKSDEFFRRYQTAQTDDRMDFVEWASLVRMRDNLVQRLQVFSGELTACVLLIISRRPGIAC